MKYEMIFGDEKLFDGASEFVEVIRFNDYSRECLWGDLNTIQLLTFRELKAIPIVAMRRIIEEPKRWTVEDQKAGRLPEVGAKVDGGKVVFVNGFNVVTELKSGAVIVSSPKTFLNTFNPIETPEEKAARLREEWCSDALGSASILSGMKEYELKRLGGYVGNIYDALLSGELSMPSKGGE